MYLSTAVYSNISAATLHAFLNGNENKCPESTHFRVDSYNIEVLCKSKLVVTEIKIIFNSNASICELRVNGGRDLTKEANFAISFDSHSHSINYVHENIEENCLIIKRPGKKISLESKFDWPREVYQIVIHTQETSDTSLNNIIVEMFNDEDRLVFSRVLDHFAFIHEFNFDKHDFIMKIVLSTSNVLSMCGIQAYGECTKRRYGIHCDHICSITCRYQDCQFTGVCKECMPNRVGDYCMDCIF
ncbi:uncharacterized protein LOC131950155 [Physella acuta]|uniref:uncharacterized protein LOC131950155 n=1 Tax=Physella acuta TaxID=109671 RepID=UPI0027DBBDA4|nr:uncharacterized protein LOC131950155 [Physella acuta]